MPVQKRKGHAARAGNNSPKLNRGIGYVVAAIALAVLLIATVPGLGRTLATLLGLAVAGATALKVFGAWRGRKEEVAVQSLRVFKDAQPMAEPLVKANDALDADLQARRTEQEAQRETQRQVERDLENLRERTTAALNQRASATKARKRPDETLPTGAQLLEPSTAPVQGHTFAGDTPERQKRLEELVAKRHALEAELQARRTRVDPQRETHRQVERDLENLRARTKADLNKAWLEAKEKQTSDRTQLVTQQTPQATQQPVERDLHDRQAVPDLNALWFGPDNMTAPGETKQPAPPPDPWYAQMSKKNVEAAQRSLSEANEQRAATKAKDAATSSAPAAEAPAPWYSAVSTANHAASLRKLQDLEVSAARALESFDRIAESITPRAVLPPSNPLGIVSQTAAPVSQPGPALDDLVEIYAPARPYAETLTLPRAPEHIGQARWIPAHETCKVADFTISGGMVYVGTVLKSVHRDVDPGLINPLLPVAAHEDHSREDAVPYWPRYADISPAQRRTYLKWLAGGRSDPTINVGYLFLFFYGLERRAILDAFNNEAAQVDRIAIEDELLRLLSIYGESANGFKRYAHQLLDWCRLAKHTGRVYDQPLPEFEKTNEMPAYLKLAIGYAALDKAPLTPTLARLFILHEPSMFLRTPATRCPAVFAKLFEERYQRAFPTGLVLSPNRTKLKFAYHSASDALRGFQPLELKFNDVPDVSVLTAPFNKLRPIVEEATDELDSYSRYVGKNPDSVNSLDAVLLLPPSVWPDGAREALDKLKSRMSGGMLSLQFQELLDALQAKTAFSRDRTVSLAKALQVQGIGMEPDVLSGGRVPKLNEPVVLFEHDQDSSRTPAYQTALLTLELAMAVVMADGSFSDTELQHLREQVRSWSDLDVGHLRRLDAHLRLLTLAPIPLSTLRKKLEPLDDRARRTLAGFMVALAQADGVVTPDEIRVLEKVYKALGVDANQVFSDVHAAATGALAPSASSSTSNAATPSNASNGGFKLDTARIAALHQDTARVSALLVPIFEDPQADVTPPAPSSHPAPEAETSEPAEAEAVTTATPQGALGLDEQHAKLVRLLLSRSQWSRAELADAAADLELMADGALERINDACFDRHDQPLIEGDDPLDVNPEIAELLQAA
jgi:uncharacterized tellurite resistance protein B-like protein